MPQARGGPARDLARCLTAGQAAVRRPAREPSAPHHTPRTKAEKAAREARLADEMRENLLKRKRQQRAREAASTPGD